MTPCSPSGYQGRSKRSKFSVRPFIATIAVILILALQAWIADKWTPSLSRSDEASMWKKGVHIKDEECRLVHHATDKCAFVKANCADEEAGIFSYLALYYCRMHRAQPLAFVLMVLWLALLFSTIGIAASDFFCVNLSTISTLLGMSESMAGVTFLAFGNGSPDVFSTFAAMSTNSGSLAIGELIGAAGFITAVVAGSMALVRPFKVARKSFVRDVCFFIVAAGFSMLFLWDGKLYLWECITMVVFYFFYVGFVVVWHYWLGRSRRRRERISAMRSQYVQPGGEEEDVQLQYHDDDDGYDAPQETTPLRRSTDDFLALQQGGDEQDLELDDNEEERDRWLGELNSNMRLNRPRMGSRRNTHNPIRPSLVGALEFRAVLSSLKKSRNIQTTPINLRRYSDDPTYTTAQQQGPLSAPGSVSHLSHRLPPNAPNQYLSVSGSSLEPHKRVNARARAVSANDATTTRLDPSKLGQRPPSGIDADHSSFSRIPPFSREQFDFGLRTSSPVSLRIPQTPTHLAPPDGEEHTSQPSSPLVPPSLVLEPPESGAQSHPSQPGASPISPFPAYSDFSFPTRTSSRAPSIRLPSPSFSPESYLPDDHFLGTEEFIIKMPRWWPYKFVPAPGLLLSTLFPTLYHWSDKGFWERLLGVVAAPSVFLLTITLPVVETPKEENSDLEEVSGSQSFSLPGPITPVLSHVDGGHRGGIIIVEPEGSSRDSPPEGNTAQTDSGNGRTTARYTDAEGSGNVSHGRLDAQPGLILSHDAPILQSPEQLPTAPSQMLEPKQWNRWLVIIQAFTAPFFIVVIIWANTEPESPRALLKPTLYSLLCSLCMLGLLLATTTPTRPPRWRALLCFLGFAVSISWISTIANEVVGVLKTLGIILNMSDAILGLTIFAVGNSLGDLVADITVARLGYPVMALSACFGGPMLNILLGIGISGCYMTIKGGNHRHERHPDRPYKFKPYHIDVSTTLVISGATLLVTLVGLLVAVPLRGWKMDRRIGWGLIGLWGVSTVTNVIVEVVWEGGKLS
ncbi:hypothetical protein GQ43DRAFT_19278 [Delitschia confertaspora ATCC 74209]|uniref:Sodium/calcium exchanger membrane region domain-containing protein n=1 Tax=Delitschia confertaspora ATCC 74209 TaxID=1513339 RepID=A0A9P4JMK4_9PLEO|nr:hypothetical protein GQ43DRAFT_19278 [Delitschia confertaspora ATCC 74209]